MVAREEKHAYRADSVNPDSSGEELVGEASGHGDLSTLGHRVVEEHRGSSVSDLGSGGDDRSSLGNVGNGSPGEPEGTVDVGLHSSVELDEER
jgi:hypothetical protein